MIALVLPEWLIWVQFIGAGAVFGGLLAIVLGLLRLGRGDRRRAAVQLADRGAAPTVVRAWPTKCTCGSPLQRAACGPAFFCANGHAWHLKSRRGEMLERAPGLDNLAPLIGPPWNIRRPADPPLPQRPLHDPPPTPNAAALAETKPGHISLLRDSMDGRR